MSNQHPITPPPDLVNKWHQEYLDLYSSGDSISRSIYVATQAAQWGADQELEACVEWLGDAPVVWNNNKAMHPGSFLRTARRPKELSLKERIAAAITDGDERTALSLLNEALPND